MTFILLVGTCIDAFELFYNIYYSLAFECNEDTAVSCRNYILYFHVNFCLRFGLYFINPLKSFSST
jgi:hypothetical protein